MPCALPTPAPAQPDALALAEAQLYRLGAELTPCRSADDVAALLTAMAKNQAGMHNRAQHIGDELGISTFEVERLLVRLADRPAWMELSERPALHVPSADGLVLVPNVHTCVACGGSSLVLAEATGPRTPPFTPATAPSEASSSPRSARSLCRLRLIRRRALPRLPWARAVRCAHRHGDLRALELPREAEPFGASASPSVLVPRRRYPLSTHTPSCAFDVPESRIQN